MGSPHHTKDVRCGRSSCIPPGESPDLANPTAISIAVSSPEVRRGAGHRCGATSDLGCRQAAARAVVNASLAILGFFSLRVAVFHLLPIRPFDGAIAGSLLPAFLKRLRAKAARRQPGWPSWRQICRIYSHCLTLLGDTAYSFVEGIFRPCADRTGVACGCTVLR
jgi:hypothetical protein